MGVEGGRGEGRGEAGAGVGRVLPEMLSVAPVGPWLGARARRSSLALPHSTCSDCSELELPPPPHDVHSDKQVPGGVSCVVWGAFCGYVGLAGAVFERAASSASSASAATNRCFGTLVVILVLSSMWPCESC